MDGNLLLEQYSRYKKIALEESPYKCLLNTEIEINPHQINAFCAAIESLKTGGIVLADEVGLGKTIEAGLVIKYVLDSGAKKILIAVPATLRKQWEIELDEKGVVAKAKTSTFCELAMAEEPGRQKIEKFHADEPFQYMILSGDENPELLFYGQVVE